MSGFSFGSNTTGKSSFFGGTATTTASNTGFSFGGLAKTTAQSTNQNVFGFGNTSTTGFGSGFGKTTTASSGFGGFGKTTTTASTGFGSTAFNFTSKPATSTTGFGSTLATGGLFGQQQQQQQQQQNPGADSDANILLATATALSSPIVYGDERDSIITKFNQVQAFWGTGRGYYTKEGAFIDFTPQSHFCRFKAVGYSCLSTTKDEDGLVSIVCSKKHSDITSDAVKQAIHSIMGANQTVSVTVDDMRPLPDDKTEITIYVSEQSSVIATPRRIPASSLYQFFQQANIQQKLKQGILMETCVPRVAMTPTQIEQLLFNPPSGIDPVIWEQAKKDNPDPKTLIPVPMVGFNELNNRLRHQELMAKQHQSRLDILSKGLGKIQEEQTSTQSTIEQYKRKLLDLSHRFLQVIIAQEIYRKAGFAIQPEEEQLRVHLEALFNQLNSPNQFRGSLNELLSQMRMHPHHQISSGCSTSGHNQLEPEALQEIQLHLRKQQEGLNSLVRIIKEDFNDLKIIESSLAEDDQSRLSSHHHGYYPNSSVAAFR